VPRPALTSDVWFASSGAPALARVLDLNRRTYLLDDLLVKTDRMSMAHGLEVRSPLLDPVLLEFAVRVPPGEHLRGRQLKQLLKLALRGVLPDAVIDRPKKGFGVPLDGWFRGELRAETRQRLTSPTSRVSRFLDVGVLTETVEQHQRGTSAHGQRLWTLLCLERFLEREGW
jgi:asparagine synthase (glutamine-hydrolysing)